MIFCNQCVATGRIVGLLTRLSRYIPLKTNQSFSINSIRKLHACANMEFEEPNLDQVRDQFRRLEGGEVVLTKDDASGLAFICINHVEKKNAISGKMMVDLNNAVVSLESWDVGKGVILHAKGDTFCSGGDFTTCKILSSLTDGFRMASIMQDSVIRLSKLPMISAAVVHGRALGGGADLILATDFRLLTPKAEISFVEANTGTGTAWGGGTLLTQLIGHQKALDLLLTCRKITPEEAMKVGLADEIMEEENHLENAINWMNQRVNQHDPSLVHTVKQIVSCRDMREEKKFFARSWGGKVQLKAVSQNLKHK